MDVVRRSWPLALTWPLAAVVAVVSAIGLFASGAYADDADSWVVQARAQDATDLFVALPLLVASAVLVRRRASARAYVVWLGTVISLAYAFAIYAFDVSYGPLFLVYVAGLGLAAWALVGGAIQFPLDALDVGAAEQSGARTAGRILVAIAVVFAVLWLSSDIPAALEGRVPDEVRDLDLPTNPVHVLDLAFLLPASIAAGMGAIRGSRAGVAATAVLLVALLCISAGIEMIFAFDYAENRDSAVLAPAMAMLVPAVLAAWGLARVLPTLPRSIDHPDREAPA